MSCGAKQNLFIFKSTPTPYDGENFYNPTIIHFDSKVYFSHDFCYIDHHMGSLKKLLLEYWETLIMRITMTTLLWKANHLKVLLE